MLDSGGEHQQEKRKRVKLSSEDADNASAIAAQQKEIPVEAAQQETQRKEKKPEDDDNSSEQQQQSIFKENGEHRDDLASHLGVKVGSRLQVLWSLEALGDNEGQGGLEKTSVWWSCEVIEDLGQFLAESKRKQKEEDVDADGDADGKAAAADEEVPADDAVLTRQFKIRYDFNERYPDWTGDTLLNDVVILDTHAMLDVGMDAVVEWRNEGSTWQPPTDSDIILPRGEEHQLVEMAFASIMEGPIGTQFQNLPAVAQNAVSDVLRALKPELTSAIAERVPDNCIVDPGVIRDAMQAVSAKAESLLSQLRSGILPPQPGSS